VAVISRGRFDRDAVAATRAEVEQIIRAEQRKLFSRWRPPIGAGIGMVLAGFVLQLIGVLLS
jgi:hypothetical protein